MSKPIDSGACLRLHPGPGGAPPVVPAPAVRAGGARHDSARDAEPTARPDARLLERLFLAEKLLLAVVTLVAGGVLLLWLVPALQALAPAGWSKMVAYTALMLLLSVAGLHLSGERRSPPAVWASRWLGAAVLLFSLLTLIEYASGRPLGYDLWLPHAPGALAPGRPAPQTALAFALIGVSLLLMRESGGLAAKLGDAVLALLTIHVMVLIGAYLFGAAELLRADTASMTSPQTVLCLACLTCCVAGRRAAGGGLVAVLVDIGMGGRAVRALLPLLIAMPFAAFALADWCIRSGALRPSFAYALVAACTSSVVFWMTVYLARRINVLESDLRSMSLTDELTGIYNRRGFKILGEQALREARRNGSTLTVFFFDLDGLKAVNDSQGHDAGSRFIVDMAGLLRAQFRDADIVARVGGDEFAVVTQSAEAGVALRRVAEAAQALNQSRSNSYLVRYSVGEAVYDADSGEAFEQVVGRADMRMYEQKQAKKAAARQLKSAA